MYNRIKVFHNKYLIVKFVRKDIQSLEKRL